MKTTYLINFVCSDNLNSPDNIDYEFSVDRDYLPEGTMHVGGIFMVIENSIYDVAKDEGRVYATCYYPRNRTTDPFGEIDIVAAQKITYDLIAQFSERYGLKGTYTTRNRTCRPADTHPEDLL